MPLEGSPKNEGGCHEWEADSEVYVHRARLVILLAVVPLDYVCAHECLRHTLVGSFELLDCSRSSHSVD